MAIGNAIALGNLSIDELLKRTGYDMSQNDIDILKSHLQENATIDPFSDKFHIFDLPFSIVVGSGFKKQLISILMKYEEISPSKEPLQVNESIETEKEREKRLKAEKEEQTRISQNENPNSVWQVKWHMLVPVVVNGKDYYYGCFINTYIKDKKNIPDTIKGTAFISMDDEGLHGRFTLAEPDISNNGSIHPTWNYVIGLGFYTVGGRWLGTRQVTFERVDFSIEECIENTKQFDRFVREIYFDRIDS